MDATRRVLCNNHELFNPMLAMGMQISLILVLSHLFQIVLKPLGQPGPISQILSGFVLGPSCISRIQYIKRVFFQDMSGDYYETMALFSRIIFMFLIGLETDIGYLVRNLRSATTIAAGGCITCTIFAAAITPFIYHQTAAHGPTFTMVLMLAVVFSNAAAPFVIRIAVELKFATTDFGRLVICSSLISDMYAVLLVVISSRSKHSRSLMTWLLYGLLALVLVIAVIVANMYLTNWLNRKNPNEKHLKNTEAFIILSIIVITAMIIEYMGFNSMIACFLLGLMFRRAGKTTRTLLPKLNYAVHNFIYPVYLGYVGFQADITSINSLQGLSCVVVVVLLGLGGKITGTLAACHHLGISLREGVLFAFLMNVKGHVDLVALSIGLQNKVSLFTLENSLLLIMQIVTSPDFYPLMVVTLVVNTLIVGPTIVCMVRRETDTLGYGHLSLEWQDPEVELRMLVCVHGPRHVATMVGLIAALRGPDRGPVNAFMMHLIELPEKTNTDLMYHQREDDELSDDDAYGGNDVVEINQAVDNFNAETGVLIHQTKAVSPFLNMHSDVCDRAEGMRASMIFLPFHKHRRIDGRMETGKDGIRTANQKVLRHAKCSVAILVDRGISRSSQSSGAESLQQVATLFFGGPDDREALGFSKRLGMHHHMNLTIIRFLPESSKGGQYVGVNIAHKEDNVVMAVTDREAENEADTAMLTDFYNRYVTTGIVGYVEKYVENGNDTASALRELADLYTLFIVGKGGRGQSPLTIGMSDWEECPELGTVGDLLASSDFDTSGSVLVVQQHRISKNEDDK
ncbi:cation/H(+) antiporter 2-like [Impatiens glandulifera]|uniref:cation/H(+) antiporter 2-like n=1 Tax=Impatiens glandulifera TaxID=253017 RepID=UPI001FB08D51|nr:cation/H(+) antiporter 2-like [Impatiens glandulifera]